MRARQKALFDKVLLFGGALIFSGWGVVGWGINSCLGPAEIASISSQDLSQSNEHDTFWYVVLTGYFYILFSWAIAVSDFLSLEIYKNSRLPLSSITFKVNIYTENHFYKYICFKYDTVWNHFQRFFIWTLEVPTGKLFECVWPFCGVGA